MPEMRRAEDELSTARLRLRRWQEADVEPMVEINRDPEVARYLNRRPPGRAFVTRLEVDWRRRGFGLWALESTEPGIAGQMMGFAGLSSPAFIPQLEHEVEVGWRLARTAWGRGLATEAARAALEQARDAVGLSRVISIIHPENRRSQRVAEKLGMHVARRVHNPVLGMAVEVWELPLS
jgi:RimJ/RimL family protein N-acetyltransferase